MKTRFLILVLCLGMNSVLAQTPVYQLSDTLVAEQLYQQALDHYQANRYDSTDLLLDRAIAIYQNTTGLYNFKAWECWRIKGQAYYFAGEFEKVIPTLLFEADLVKKVMGEDARPLGATYAFIGNAYYSIGDLQSALPMLNRALNIRLHFLGFKHLKTAETYNSIGNCYLVLGNFDRAIEAYEKAQDSRMQLFQEGKGDYRTIYESIFNLGMCFSGKGDYDRAIDFFRQSLQLQRDLDPDEKYFSGKICREMGTAFFRKKDFTDAINYNLIAAEIIRASIGETNPEIALCYQNLGTDYLSLHDDKSFLLYTQKAIDTWESIRRLALPVGVAELKGYAPLYANLADYYQAHKNYPQSIENYQKALQLIDEIFPGSPESYGLKLRLSRCLTDQGDTAGAEKLLLEALQSEGDNPMQFLPITIPASAQIALLRLDRSIQRADAPGIEKAWQDFLVFDRAVHDKRAEMSSEGSKMATAGNLRKAYEQAIDAAWRIRQSTGQDHYLHEAFRIAERVRALVLLEGSHESAALQFGGLPDSLRARERSLRLDLAYLEARATQVANTPHADLDPFSRTLTDQIFNLKNEYIALKQMLERDYPDYYKFKYNRAEQDIPGIQRQLDAGEAIVEYFTGDSSLFLFCIQKNAFTVQKIERDFPLEQWVADLRTGLTAFHTDPAMFAKFDSLAGLYANAAQRLYQKLLAPLPPDLPERLIFIPDKSLALVPFEVLLISAPRGSAFAFSELPYLLRKHEISYAYSATLFSEKRSKPAARTFSSDFYGFAPQYSGDTSMLAKLFRHASDMPKGLTPLPFSGEEVYRAAKIMHGQAFVGMAADKKQFYAVAPDARILHLATHGQANDRAGNYCFLVFSEKQDASESELLYAADIYNLQLKADLVVLSACETSLGELQPGEGVLSLARAFTYAGAKGVITSMWRVNDARTKDLMIGFYENLSRGFRPAAALRNAKLSALEHSRGQDASPFFWAGFVGIGDLR